MSRHSTNPWVVLVLICFAQFMVVLDATVVNVALPSIQKDLGMTEANLQWVVNAYTLVFGGFLLLGGRAGDLLGRKRLFLGGVIVFTLASLLDGHGLPAASAPRRGASITLSGRLARVYGYASLVGPALFTGVIEQARAMLDMAIAACRDPDPGSVGEALETIGAALIAADRLLEDEDGVRAAIDLVYRAIVRAATEIPDRA